jgi:uncharacterized repeat protein (TIGR01451 family)
MSDHFLTRAHARNLKARPRARRLFLEQMEPRTLLATFANPAAITITDGAAATPYPSDIVVAGFPAGSTIDKVTVTINNFSHAFPDDVDMLLVGPGGLNAIIWSDVGGGIDVLAANLVTITLDDAAASSLPDASQIVPGTFQPTNIGAGDAFPGPAPAPGGGSALSVFNGADPNGTWSLYVVDDLGGDAGAISGGWSLNIATEPAANLSITKTASSNVVNAGEELFYDIHVFNAGPNTAINTVVTDTLPTGLVFLGDTAITSPAGGCTGTTTLTCNLGNIPSGGSRDFQIKVRVPADFVALEADGTKTIINTATVSSVSDIDESNNTSSVATFVEEQADLRITKFTEPFDTALAGEIIVYTIFVDNLGPSAARNVVVKDTFLSSDTVEIQSCAFSVSQGGGAITQFTCTTGELVSTQFGTDIGTFGTNFLMPLGRIPDPMDPTNTLDVGRLRASFRVRVKAGDSGASVEHRETYTLTNTSRVTSPTPDPDTSNNLAISELTVIPVADLSLTKQAVGEEQQVSQAGLMFNNAIFGQAFPTAPNYFVSTRVTAGRRIQYTLTVTNNGPSKATNVVVTDLLPAGVTIYQGSLTTTKGTCDGGTPGEPLNRIVCGLGTLDAVQNPQPPSEVTSATITFQVIVDASTPAGDVVINEANVTSDTYDADNDDNQAHTENTVLAAADLSVSKSSVGQNIVGYNATLDRLLQDDVANAATAGMLLRYQIQVQNNGPSDSQNVTLRDVLPSVPLPGPLTFLSADGADCRPDTANADSLFCSVGTLAAGARKTFDLYVLVDSSVPAGTLLTNTVTALNSGSNTVPPGAPPAIPGLDPDRPLTWDPETTNNTASNNTTINASADLAIDKSSDEQKVDAGTQTKFTITVENLGPSVALDVRVVDVLPVGVTFETDTDACVEGPVGTLTCTIGTLQPGQSVGFDVFVLVDPNLPPNTELTNTATVFSSTPDFNLENNTDTSTILALRTDTDLQIFKDAPETAEIGTLITYTITVTNAGLIPATNVEVKDFLPIGLRPQSYSPSVGNCIAGVVGDALRPTVCNLGTLAPGESAEIIVVALVANNVKDLAQLFNDALVSSDQPDTNPEDNLVHTTTTAIQTANGNVKAVVYGGNLVVTGDQFNNKLRIEAAPEAGPDAFRITPFGGTKLNGRFESFQVHGVRLYASFNMQSGNDGLFFDGPLTLRKNLAITLGQGNDTVEFFDTIVRGSTIIHADGGADRVAAVDALFGGKAVFHMSSGADDVSILGSKFNSALEIRTGSANDTVTIESSQVVGKLLVLNESHNDVVTLIDSVFSSFVELQGGKGVDTLDAGPSRGNTFVKGKTVKSFEIILP